MASFTVNILLFILAISCVVFVALFGRLPTFRNTPIGILHRLMLDGIPHFLHHTDLVVTRGRVSTLAISLRNILLYEAHPLVLIFFLCLLSGSQVLMIPYMWHRLSTLHRFVVPIICFFPYLSLYLSAFSDPGYIVNSNHKSAMRLFPYDHIIFQPGVTCRTCGFLKPARSKHCSICKRCVSKNDHHCIWLNNCVGYHNYHWFLLLLLTTSLLMSYGAFLGYMLLSENIDSRFPISPSNSGQSLSRLDWRKRLNWSEYFELWSWALAVDIQIGGVGLLCALCSPLGWGLLLYHCYLLWSGMTTNESMKWSDWKEDIADGLVFKKSHSPALNPRYRSFQHTAELESIEPWVHWPITSGQRVLRTTGRSLCEAGNSAIEDARLGLRTSELDTSWQRVWSIEEIENLYDLGFKNNLWRVIPS